MIDDYADKVYRLQTRLESYSKSVGIDLGKVLASRFKDLAAKVAIADKITTLKEVKALEREFAEILQNTNVDQTVIINQAIKTGVVSGYGAEQAGMFLIGEAAKIKKLNEQRIINKAWSHTLQEQSLTVEGFWDKYIGTSSQRIKAIPRLARQNGWAMTKTVSKLRAVTGIDKNSAMAVARTTVMSASNVARADVIAQTDVEKEIYKATLDSRTTAVCQSLDGKVFDVGKGSSPPIHISCRSVRLAVPSDMTPTEFKKGLETSSRGVDGKTKIIDYTSYGNWIKTQPRAFQESVLGVKRTKMLNDGTITFKKMFTKNGNYITVKELERRYK